MLRLTLAAALIAPTIALGAGSDSSEPPTPTETTDLCLEGYLWDEELQLCVLITEEMLDDDASYRAVREMAYAGRLDDALAVLARMGEGDSDRVLTYRGFIARKQGRMSAAMTYYSAALLQNPDNLLTRSYMGQGLVVLGDVKAARAQLVQIRARGGAGTWPATALAAAIETGASSDY